MLKKVSITYSPLLALPISNAFYISTTSCPSVSVGAPCYLEEDFTAEYPNCCPRIKCPHSAVEDVSNNEINNEIEDDQIMMGVEEYPLMVSYDASLDQVRFHLGPGHLAISGVRGSIRVGTNRSGHFINEISPL